MPVVNWSVEDYDADTEHVRSTALKCMASAQGPAGYWSYIHQEREDKKHWTLGHLLHDYVLLGEKRWFVYDAIHRGNAFKEACEENQGLIPLKEREAADLEGWREGIMKNPRARKLIESALVEQTFLWTDPSTGIKCKARADILKHNGVLADIKTWSPKKEITPKAWFYHATDLRYEFSGAMYEQGRNHCLGPCDAPFYHIAVCKNAPYWCYVWPMASTTMEYGHRDVRRALELLAQCRERESALRAEGEDPSLAYPDLMDQSAIEPPIYWVSDKELE